MNLLCRIQQIQLPPYLLNLITTGSSLYNTRHGDNLASFGVKHAFLKKVINKSNKYNHEIRYSSSLEFLRKNVLDFMKPTKTVFLKSKIHLQQKYLHVLGFNFSYLKKHLFKPNFRYTLDPLCSWQIMLNQQHISFSIARIFQFKHDPRAKRLSIQLSLHLLKISFFKEYCLVHQNSMIFLIKIL